jgi:hypothetical protein
MRGITAKMDAHYFTKYEQRANETYVGGCASVKEGR